MKHGGKHCIRNAFWTSNLENLESEDNADNRKIEAGRHRHIQAWQRPEQSLWDSENTAPQPRDSGKPSDFVQSLSSFSVRVHNQKWVSERYTIELTNFGKCSVMKTQTEKAVIWRKTQKVSYWTRTEMLCPVSVSRDICCSSFLFLHVDWICSLTVSHMYITQSPHSQPRPLASFPPLPLS